MKLVQAWIELHQDDLMADWFLPRMVRLRSKLIPCAEEVVVTPDVVQVNVLPDYCLEAVFENGERRWFDMRPLLSYPAFSALTEQNLFMKAHTAHGTVAWTDEIDLSPDTLYLRGQSLEK
jgi:hypothetical protein